MSPSFLMCEPIYFGVNYVINPWMESNVNKVDHERALKQWHGFHAALSQLTDVSLIQPQQEVPDFVFTANAALVKNKRGILSHFRYPERQAEEPYYKKWFEDQGYKIVEMPESVFFEGEGDALFQPNEHLIWMGYGMRSDKKAAQQIEKFFDTPVILLELINESFYHLDTCFCPLLEGYVMYYPGAFSQSSLKAIENQIPAEKRVLVSEEDANHFACNSVLIPNSAQSGTLVMNFATDSLQHQLSELGYKLVITPVDEFLKAGGATKCLVLNL